MKYTNSKLEELANEDLINPKGSRYYENLLKETIKNHHWNIDLNDGNASNNIHIDDLWYDCCEIINDLAQLVLDEREKRKNFLSELRHDLKNSLSQISDKNYKKYY